VGTIVGIIINAHKPVNICGYQLLSYPQNTLYSIR